MKTVYDLIQHLSKFPANADLQIVMFVGNEQMEAYLEDSRKSGTQWAYLYAEPLSVKQPWNSVAVSFECQACGL
jgi:hypothetical protein